MSEMLLLEVLLRYKSLLIRKDMAMNNTISSDLQSRLLSLSSLVNEDKRSSDAKSSEIEEIGDIILKKIYAENSNLPTSARFYLEQIASNIIDDKWSDIPKPVEMKFDFQILKGVADALALASVGTTIDLFELFGLLMKIKGDEAYNLATISIEDTKLSLKLDQQRFLEQEKANQMELGAGIASGCLQCVQGVAQAGSNITSIAKTGRLGLETKKAIDLNKETADAKIDLDSKMATKKELTGEYNALSNEITVLKAKNPNDPSINKLEETQGEVGVKLQQANEEANDSAKNYNQLSSKLEADSKLIDQKTNLERFKDQLRSSVINAVKGALDVGVAVVRFQGSVAKLEADKFEAAKNTTDRSANAMSESGRKSAEDVKKLLQSLDSILQMMDASVKKQFNTA
jgi:hypothetical protein